MPNPSWLQPLVWTDYRLAVVLTVLVPIALLIWALVQKAEPIQRLLLIYWRVASLLAITIYLLIGAIPIGFFSGWFARILIPMSLWFWIDLNDEITEQAPSPLKLSFTSWRWAVSIYSLVGAIAQIPSLRCAFIKSQDLINEPFCRTWLEAPWGFQQMFHNTTRPFFLGFLGLLALGIYALYFGYFVLFRLGKQGRSATMGQ